jgi:hypothetical protein
MEKLSAGISQISYVETHNLLGKFPFGSRKKHSTLHPLVYLMNNVNTAALNKKEHIIAMFCDLRKAFDTVNYSFY